MNNKCNFYFESQYAYIDDKAIHVSEYIEKEMHKHTSNPRCNKGHEVILVNGQIRKPHFRHKHSYDVVVSPMSEWHVEWQSNFPVTEVSYPRINEAQITNRRADVVIEDFNRIIELQHSKIERNEVINRNNDYKLHNKEVLWVIDGNSINVRHLVHSNRYYLDFNSNLWKYERFLDCDFIYLDIESQIYKVNPKNVKSHMIDVLPPFSKQEFIESLKKGEELWGEDESVQCNLYIKQQGAGNGKTYGIIQNIIAPEFSHYENIMYVTKAHSAKTIINEEFEEQLKKNVLQGLVVDSFETTKTNKYIINYHINDNGSKKQIIIGTIDSLMYTLGNKEHNGLDMFEGIINSIIDNHIETKNNAGTIYYGSKLNLNKKTCLFVDEMQDLTPDYAKAILQIMRNRYIDVYVVGDTLQSITHNKNAFVYLIENEFPNIQKTVYPFTNICRRFIHPTLVNFVNTMIPFTKYNLPEITPYKHENNDTNFLQFIEGQPIYQGCPDENLLKNEIENIMIYYKKEVEDNNRLPNDFLFVTPFTKQNALMDGLQLAINMFWKSHNTDDEYKRYAIFHKSEDGTSINIKESENATRMVSIHTSKGDGRNVVFVIGINEQSLKKFSEESENLIYHSLLHVSITRMKQKLYVRYENNGDNISQKIQNYICDNVENIDIVPNLLIFNSVKFNEITNDSNEQYEFFYENIIKNTNVFRLIREEEHNDKKIIDMSHHNIRYMSLLINLFLNIISKENTDKNSKGNTDKDEIKKQILAIFHKVKDAKIIETDTWQDYYKILNCGDKNGIPIPIHKICNHGRDYKKYFGIIQSFIKNIQSKLKEIVVLNKVVSLCPYECVVLYYMLQIYNQRAYSEISITDLYNITDIYDKSFHSSYQGHENCLCSKCFNNNSITNDETNTYLLKHYENVIKINHIYMDFCRKYPKMNWLMNHYVEHDGANDNFKIWKKMNLIGYDADNVIIAYVKPQLNALNYNSILLESIYDTYLIHNIQKYEDNDNTKNICEKYKRFFGKKITIVIFTLDSDTPYYIHWSNKLDESEKLIEKYNDCIKETLAKSLIEKMTIDCKYLYFFYSYYRKKCSEHDMNSSMKIIEEIITKYNYNKIKNETKARLFPKLIDEFFYHIKFLVEKSDKKERKQILLDYDNKEYFNQKLNEQIKHSIYRFFNLQEDDGDDDDDC